MKTKFLILAALAATLGFTACKKDGNGIEISNEEGKATAMQLSLSFPRNVGTRATADPNATNAEAEVKTVDVFIYTGNGTFSSHTPLTAAAFTQGTSTGSADVYEYTATTKIPTTTGAKSVFVGINLPTSVVNAVKNQPQSALANAVQTMSRADLTGTSGFAMFSVAPVTKTFVEGDDPANEVTVQCQRLVAKVTVETAASLDVAAVPGTLSNFKFAINNFNTKLFLLQGAGPAYKDPNWANYAAGDFTNAVNGGAGDEYVDVLSRALIANPGITDYKPGYAAENTSEEKGKGEITRATVRAAFIPNKITTIVSGDLTVNDNTNTTPATFYTVTPSVSEGTYFFYNETMANTFATEKGVTALEYTNGLSYWHIYLNKDPRSPQTPANRWDVLRNDFYKCNITKISGLGRNTPDIDDPEEKETPNVDTTITVDVEILFWNTPVLSDYVLE